MTEEGPAAPGMPECNGSVPPEKGSLQVIDDIAKSVGTVPYVGADPSPDAPPPKENQEETRNSLAEDTVHGDFDGEKQCQGKTQGCLSLTPSSPALLCVAAGLGSKGTSTGSGELGMATSPGEEVVETPTGSADGRGNAAEEEEEEDEDAEEEEEEEDTEEDEVQVIDMKKENSDASCLQPPDSSKEAPSPTSPSCNSQGEKPGEQPSLGKKNDISRHSYSRYNTISYRRIRKGNTKQRIDEFESMMHL
ncbi:ERMIN protein, partial [Brachypteracias leptosomus]|nr:ERMIN protein [Brachypteracias leptosomus]